MANPRNFVRISNDTGHHTVPAAVAERAGSRWRVLKQDALDKFGRPLPFKPRTDVEDTPPAAQRTARKRAASTLRDDTAAATPTEPENVSGESV